MFQKFERKWNRSKDVITKCGNIFIIFIYFTIIRIARFGDLGVFKKFFWFLNVFLLVFKTYCIDQGLKLMIDSYLFYLLQEMIQLNYNIDHFDDCHGKFFIFKNCVIILTIVCSYISAVYIGSDRPIYAIFIIFILFCQVSSPRLFEMTILSVITRIGCSLIILFHLTKCVKVSTRISSGIFYVINGMWVFYTPIQLLILVIPQVIFMMYLKINGKLDVFCGR